MTKRLATDQALSNPEVLKTFALKTCEKSYTKNVIRKLNSELSPFRDEETRDQVFVRKMLDTYRHMEEFEEVTTDKHLLRNDRKLHTYLKEMEVGAGHDDAKTVRAVHEGTMELENKKMKDYLIKKLQQAPRAY